MLELGDVGGVGDPIPLSGRILVDKNTRWFQIHLLPNFYSALHYKFSLVFTFTHFRNAVSQEELHVIAPEWLHFVGAE